MREKCAAQVHNTTSPARVGSTEECLAFSNDVLNIWSLESTFPCIFLEQLSRKFLSMFCYHNDLCYFTITLSWVKVCGAVSVTERQIFPGIWTLKPRWPGRTFFHTITSLSQHSGQNGITFTRYMHFHSRRMRINSVSKVTRFNEAMIVMNDATLGMCDTIFWFCPSWIPPRSTRVNFPYEQTAKFVPVTEPGRFSGSYQEALTDTQRIRCTRRWATDP